MTPWNDATKYMRIVAMSFFVYDWACTLPAEVRLYRKQRWSRPSTACVLLLLTRYLGLAALVLNIYGFFSHQFTKEVCAQYYRVMPVVQVAASWASHAVFVVRTIAICNKDRTTTIVIVIFAIIVALLELFAQMYSFRRFKAGSSGNCLIQYSDDVNVSWLYYLVSSLFDIVVVYFTYRGLAVNFDARKTDQSAFSDVLWNSSILYFVTTTIINLLNLAFYAYYQNSNATVLGAVGIAFTSMMSARVILNLHDYVHRPASFQLSNFKSSGATSMGPVSPVSPHHPSFAKGGVIRDLEMQYPIRRPGTQPAPWESHWERDTVTKDVRI
ncbi:hypothetical protein CYLTODRAFT_435640 [Cylindrobasidium torrendii FP15055 ss-10]|uniref:DUF6533 domain-containing protein n=1 Tax=Cylindrobasidium torrendii FP15055 ss-10 TaxID=1314674 RepID=A0A0D7BKB2_9AGAR|nr:hypothetical protein CYLTODRAFT_435640 [Cylindrobasidium torrendii FP15055 ss-10]